MHHISSFKDLFVHELRDLYSAENQIISALPKMIQAANSSDLKAAFRDHLEETRGHVVRLNEAFSHLGVSSGNVTCQGMQGLLEEGEEALKLNGNKHLRDAALISAAQRVEHYEIAAYGTARSYANELGYGDIADLLDETLDEESAADEHLTDLAEGGLLRTGINEEART